MILSGNPVEIHNSKQWSELEKKKFSRVEPSLIIDIISQLLTW